MSEEPTIEERPPWKCPECGCEPAISCAMYGRNGDRTMRCKPCTDNFNDVRWLREQLLAARAKLTTAADHARSLLVYAQNGHYGPDDSGLAHLREIIAIAWLEKVAPPPQSG